MMLPPACQLKSWPRPQRLTATTPGWPHELHAVTTMMLPLPPRGNPPALHSTPAPAPRSPRPPAPPPSTVLVPRPLLRGLMCPHPVHTAAPQRAPKCPSRTGPGCLPGDVSQHQNIDSKDNQACQVGGGVAPYSGPTECLTSDSAAQPLAPLLLPLASPPEMWQCCPPHRRTLQGHLVTPHTIQPTCPPPYRADTWP